MSSIDPAALLSAIVSWSDDAIVSKDLNGIITSWNRAAERVFGYSAEEAVGRSIELIIPTGRHAEEADVLSRIRRGETVNHFETIRRRKDGTLIPISLTVSPVRSASGQIVGASKIARDISERWRAEAAIAEAQAAAADLQRRLLTLVAASGSLLGSPRVKDVLPATLALAKELVAADGYALWRLDAAAPRWGVGSYDGVSDEFASTIVSFYRGDSVIPLASTDPLVYEDVQATPVVEERRDAYRREGIVSMPAIPLAIRGQASGILVFYYRVRHQFSEVEIQTARALGNLAAAAMTTAELYGEEQRSHERAMLLATVAEALANSLDYDATLKMVAAAAVPQMADWCAVHLAGEEGGIDRLAVAHVDPAKVEFARSFQERYPEDPSSPHSIAHVIRTGKPVLVERVTEEMIVTAARSEEQLRDLRQLQITSFMIVPLVAHGRSLGTISFVSAESGRCYGAADLRFAEDVASRAALGVDNARAYEEARRANRLKDEFLATLSHELRTPLNAILGYARMLRTGVLVGEKHARALQVLERSAASLAQIVEDVLDVSRITSGKMRLNPQPVQLPIVVSDAVATVLPAAEAKGVAVNTSIDPLVAPVRGDADRLQQVVWNLASNAVKFTPRGGRVDVRVESLDTHVQVVVSDTGIGFPPEFAAHMFERFRQADSGFAREHGGLGLGLAIARHLAELHGGTIEASSGGRNQGATFRVVLPMAGEFVEPPAPERPLHRRVVALGTTTLGGLNGVHVLAVDDDGDALALVREILEAAGAHVTTVGSAQSALDQIARVRPDALIADLGMPGVDGFELIERIRGSQDTGVRSLPAAALTAYARSEDRTRALRQGFQVHLAKPIDPSELVAAVRSLIRHPQIQPSDS